MVNGPTAVHLDFGHFRSSNRPEVALHLIVVTRWTPHRQREEAQHVGSVSKPATRWQARNPPYLSSTVKCGPTRPDPIARKATPYSAIKATDYIIGAGGPQPCPSPHTP